MSLSPQKFLSESEDQNLIALLQGDESRDALMLSLLRFCGMRATELLKLRGCDLLHANGSIWVRGLKSSNSRELPVKRDLFERLMREAQGLGPEDLVFGIGYNRLMQIWHFYRPAKKPLHSLRHTLARQAYLRTRDVKLVQQVLGHKCINSTMVYQDFLCDRSQLRKALL